MWRSGQQLGEAAQVLRSRRERELKLSAARAAQTQAPEPEDAHRNDARGIAQLVRLGWFRLVHVKSEEAQQIRMLLVNRNLLLGKLQDIENSVRRPGGPIPQRPRVDQRSAGRTRRRRSRAELPECWATLSLIYL